MAPAVCFIVLLSCLSSCAAVLPAYILSIQLNNVQRDDLIRRYFHLGLNYAEILAFLILSHGIRLSLRQLKRILRSQGLFRWRGYSDQQEIIRAVELELHGSGCLIGYRLMHQRLRCDYGLIVNKETVRLILRALDREGVERRSRPNYIWHIDGYDKLKPFGFCIHGAIDGYSRRILWLEVGTTNNDPKVIAEYFCDCVKQLKGVPRIVRADEGTENCNVAAIQCFLRRNCHDVFAGDKSFMYGRSVSNQRIEAWWAFLRRSESDWWIKFFRDLRDSGVYCDGNAIHVECLKFCFMQLLQDELNQVAKHWNLHKIRPSTNGDSPAGRPDVLYFLPELQETMNFCSPVPEEELELVREMCCDKTQATDTDGCFADLASLIVEEEDLSMPDDAEDAVKLYVDH